MSETSGQGGRTVESRLLHWQNKVGSDVNTAEGKPFGKRKSPLGVHVVGLAGCTALLIVSKKGFYMAHYWENIAFNLDEGMIPEVFESQEEAFQETVLDGLKEGFKGWPARGTKAEQVSLTELANDIDDPDIHAFLVIPATGQSTDEAEGEPDPYRTYWDRIKDEVGKIITRLDPNTPAGLARWTEYPYAPVQKSEEVPGQIQLLFRSTRGRVLFKYDPKHRRADGTRTKKTLVIIENEIKQEASWEW
ncbi:hypothetical protein QBC34DRAFT_296984 [Podospora aff. communis PSN243]|uniref:Uncharacterized protein n=1 Tax=Podospora aff. communis PSN243 TaxID=3040156 RepID=A0AAV9GSI8_9PEZI|nr:hypothetical protein QBC34DRAFT_296984 [Podospora aff. communis PSN243]